MHISTNYIHGLQLGRVSKEGAKTVTFNINLPTGLAYTPEAVASLLLYTDVITAGAGKLSREAFLRAESELGANITVTLSEMAVSISVATPKDNLEATLKLLTLMLTKPTLAETELKRAKSTIGNILLLEKENARGIALANLRNSFAKAGERLFAINPEVLSATLPSIKRTALLNIHKQLFLGTVTLTTGGDDISIKKVEGSLIKLVPKSTPASSVTTTTQTSVSTKRVVKLAAVPSKQNIELSIGAPLPLNLSNPDLPAFLFGLAVLGKWGGFSGRLMSTVREKEGLTYMIYARPEAITARESGYWRIVTFFAPKDVVKGITSTIREITNIVEKGISDSEWNRFKTIIKTSEILTYDSLNSTTALVHNKLVAGQSWEEYQQFKRGFDTCSRAEVNKALKKYLNPKGLIVSAAGPIKGYEKALQDFAK